MEGGLVLVLPAWLHYSPLEHLPLPPLLPEGRVEENKRGRKRGREGGRERLDREYRV